MQRGSLAWSFQKQIRPPSNPLSQEARIPPIHGNIGWSIQPLYTTTHLSQQIFTEYLCARHYSSARDTEVNKNKVLILYHCQLRKYYQFTRHFISKNFSKIWSNMNYIYAIIWRLMLTSIAKEITVFPPHHPPLPQPSANTHSLHFLA